uniref:Uncharacterized protein n=1 Tax=viral metagenome TaxID=1070528 RepID=A0A6H1ZLB3_9ZZZZ
MDKTIKELKKTFDFLNKYAKNDENNACIYCGLIATDKEHLIPRSWIEETKRLKALGFNVEIPKEVIVPACRECNMIATGNFFKGFKEKKEFIQEKIIKRYKRFAKISFWTEEEINELEGRLREEVFYFNEIAKIIQKRLKKLGMKF